MIDPSAFPLKPLVPHHEINVLTGHIRNKLMMTPRMADYLNQCNHTKDTGYKWKECSLMDLYPNGRDICDVILE